MKGNFLTHFSRLSEGSSKECEILRQIYVSAYSHSHRLTFRIYVWCLAQDILFLSCWTPSKLHNCVPSKIQSNEGLCFFFCIQFFDAIFFCDYFYFHKWHRFILLFNQVVIRLNNKNKLRSLKWFSVYFSTLLLISLVVLLVA